MNELTAEAVRDALEYDPDTGQFRWRRPPNRRIKSGAIAGTKSHDRRQIRLYGKIHREHRLAWLHFYGEWPKQQIDHINGVPSDNRIANLRDVSQSVNLQNQRRAGRRNKIGLLGVSPDGPRRWRATIDGQHIGCFGTPREAHMAYVREKRARHVGNTL